MTARLIVRAEVIDSTARADFDGWYQEEHLPDALKAFAALSAWRGWSEVESDVHYAVYEFKDLASAMAIAESSAIKKLIAEFDQRWGSRVKRSRDIVEIRQEIVRS